MRFNLAWVGLAAALAATWGGSSARANIIVWDFGAFPGGLLEQSVGSSSLTVTELTSQGNEGITATGYLLQNYQSYTPGLHTLYQKDNQKSDPSSDEQGLGMLDVNDHELGLVVSGTGTNGTPINTIQVDLVNVLGFANGYVSAGSVQAASGDAWDLWGSNTPGIAGFNSATQLLSDRTEDWGTAVAIPSWGTYRYLFMTETPNPADSSTANVLFGTIQVDDTSVGAPEPASLGLLGGGALALLRRRRR